MEKARIRKNMKVMVVKGFNQGIVGRVVKVKKDYGKNCVLITTELRVTPEEIESCGRMLL